MNSASVPTAEDSPPIAVLDLAPAHSNTYPGSIVFRSLADLLQAAPQIAGLYVLAAAPTEAADLIRTWRASPYWYSPVFVEPSDAVPELADGMCDYATARTTCLRTEHIRRSLQLDPNTLQSEERLLYYLYLREHHELRPVRDRNSKYLYRYAEAQAIDPRHDDAGLTVAALTRRNLLQAGELIDRTRHCRTCGSGHLHYLDVCPHCRSIEIKASEALHCFTCGHVAPNEEYADGGKLTCPR